MVVVPIGTYFVTVDLFFKGRSKSLMAEWKLIEMLYRQCHLRGGSGSFYGQRRVDSLRDCGHEGRSKRETGGGAESEEGSMNST